MPDTRGRPLPGEVLDALKSPTVQAWLKNFIINQGSAASIGRIPGFESAQNDQYVYPDDADVNFAYNFDYVIPSNFQRLVSAKLSLKIRAFRSYNNFSATATGGQSNTHVHVEASHSHSIPIDLQGVTANVSWPSGGANHLASDAGPGTAPTNPTSPGNTGGASADHTHTVSITSTLGIFEDVAPNNPGITVKIDGVDVTSQVVPAGPFNSDQVEVDVTQVLKTGIKTWHTLSLQPNQRVRLTGILRISYYIDSRLAQ
jgi:hypothetical protein